MHLRNLSPTHKALWLLAIVSLAMFFIVGKWHRGKVIDQDVISYYSYLPAVVVEGDIKMRYAIGNPYFADKVWGDIWCDTCGPVQKYTMGLSLMYAPFFFAGHASALALGEVADGYSTPYTFWLQLSAVFYLILGLYWLRKVLLNYFSEAISAIVLLLLALGTNLFYYTMGQATMPHVYLFALVSLMLWLTIRFYAAPTWKGVLFLALTMSLITLIRPNHILLWLVPLGYGLTSLAALRKRLHLLPNLLVFPLVQILVLLPQLFYWKMMTGHWLYYSYRDEGFFWTDPEILKMFFSYRKGWLLYTPLMALGVLGLFLLRKYAREFSLVIPIVLVLSCYVMACWWSWWYGGSFGQRIMIDFYPMLGIAMAALLTYLHSKLAKPKLQFSALILLGLLVVLNLFQTFQFSRGVIHYDSMTAKAYWRAFGRVHRSPTQSQDLEAPDYEAAKRGIR